jgi:hypothetical protein
MVSRGRPSRAPENRTSTIPWVSSAKTACASARKLPLGQLEHPPEQVVDGCPAVMVAGDLVVPRLVPADVLGEQLVGAGKSPLAKAS